MRGVLLISLLTAVALPLPAAAQSVEELAQVSVLPGWREANGDHIAAIQIDLAPGWITYWRAPGDGGIPPEFAFQGDGSFNSVTPSWPTPNVFYSNGMHAIGYEGSVVFPLTVGATSPGPLAISGELFIGICEEICIPVTLSFDTELPEIGAPDTRISAALAAAAIPARDAHVGSVTCRIDPLEDGLQVTAEIPLARTGPSEFVVIETGSPEVWVSEADVLRDGGTLVATVDMVHPSGSPFALDRSSVRMTVLGGPRAIDIKGCQAG